MPTEWSKTLTDSDAQQDTLGSKMPFRFTKAGMPHDHTTWFRDTLFGGLGWKNSTSQRGKPVEVADVEFDVTILGNHRGVRKMQIDHDVDRAGNHSAPTTHLHYDAATKAELSTMNLTGHVLSIVKCDDGTFTLEVYAA